MKRLIALIVAAAGLATVLTSCEVTQIDWRNHFYVVSQQSCLADGSTTVRNGTGITVGTYPGAEGVRVDVVKTVYGDLNHDGIEDVAVLLRCTDLLSPNGTAPPGYEIQVFTRNGQPVARISAPEASSQKWTAQFVPSQMALSATNAWGQRQPTLTTGVASFRQSDPNCCPSIHDTYVWTWYASQHEFSGVVPTVNGP